MIRKATNEDIGRIAEILVFSKRVTYRDIFKNDFVSFNVITVENTKEVIQEVGIDHVYVYDDGIIKGMIRENENEICELYIDPFFQKQGIGKVLVDYVKQNTVYSNLYLWVLEENFNALQFYHKQGFKLSGERKEFRDTGKYLLKYVWERIDGRN